MQVSSSVMRKIWYRKGMLTIQFANGDVYDYAGVSALQWKWFKESDSKGRYFNDNIKGRYRTIRR